MAKRHRRNNRSYARRNPLGITSGLVKDAAYVTAGAVGAPLLAGFIGQSGWLDVAATGAAAVALSYGGKLIGGETAKDELLKGGLAATIIKAIKQAGFGSSLGLGLYVPNYFPTPTASDAYGRVAPPIAALPAAVPTKGMAGYARFRSRFMR